MTAVDVATVRPFERTMPPVVPVAMVALALAVTGGIFLAANALQDPSLALPATLEIAAIVLEIVAYVMAARIRPFAWDRFRQVYLWAFLAYAIQGGMIEFSFINNDTPNDPLVWLTLGIVAFVTLVPLMIAFTVARYQAVDSPAR